MTRHLEALETSAFGRW